MARVLPSIAQISEVSWFPFSDEPVIAGPWYLPQLCDPVFLFPSESPDGKWHVFAHSWIGIHHYISDSGIAWEPMKMIAFQGCSPFIYREAGVWYLLYEKHGRLLANSRRQRFRREERIAASRIEIRSSTDLVSWGDPRLLLDSRSIPFASDYLEQPLISRPQLFSVGGRYRLYFGASSVTMPDTAQKISRYFAVAEADELGGPYTLAAGEKPLLSPQPDDMLRNMGTGSVRVVPLADGFAAFQCSGWWHPRLERSGSSMTVLLSSDGISWHSSGQKPVLIPAEKGWASRYIMSCDVHYKADEKCWYCYFSATDRKSGGIPYYQESLGLLLGHAPLSAISEMSASSR